MNNKLKDLQHGNKDRSLSKINELEASISSRDQEQVLLKAKLKEAEATIEELERKLIKAQDSANSAVPPAPGEGAPPPPAPPGIISRETHYH